MVTRLPLWLASAGYHVSSNAGHHVSFPFLVAAPIGTRIVASDHPARHCVRLKSPQKQGAPPCPVERPLGLGEKPSPEGAGAMKEPSHER